MNRKPLLYVLLVVALLGVGYFIYDRFVANRTPHEFSQNATTTATTTPEEKSIQSMSTTTRYYELSYSVPNDNKVVAQSIKSRADKWLEETNITKVTNDEQAEQEFGIFEGLRYAYDSKYTIVDSTNYKSYVETVYEFTGGAHGATNNVVHILSKKDGSQIKSLSDIYNDTVYTGLSAYARKELPAQLAKKTIIISDFQDMFDDGTKSSIENWQTFYFKGDSLVIIFGQYQIGPYVIGINELEVPLSMLEKYKK
jgi:hypothetical protein